MTASIYDDKLNEPNYKMLANDLGKTKLYFDKICTFIKNTGGHLQPEWKFYNKKSGWILKLFCKKRNILFIVPCDAYFRAAFTFGDKASDLVYKSGLLPEAIKKSLHQAQKHAEGKTIQIEVKNENDLKNILTLVAIKLSA